MEEMCFVNQALVYSFVCLQFNFDSFSAARPEFEYSLRFLSELFSNRQKYTHAEKLNIVLQSQIAANGVPIDPDGIIGKLIYQTRNDKTTMQVVVDKREYLIFSPDCDYLFCIICCCFNDKTTCGRVPLIYSQGLCIANLDKTELRRRIRTHEISNEHAESLHKYENGHNLHEENEEHQSIVVTNREILSIIFCLTTMLITSGKYFTSSDTSFPVNYLLNVIYSPSL